MRKGGGVRDFEPLTQLLRKGPEAEVEEVMR